MTSLTCGAEEEATFHKWMGYIEQCREREQRFITTVVVKMKEIQLEPWQYLPLTAALSRYYLGDQTKLKVHFGDIPLIEPGWRPEFKKAYTDGVMVWKHVTGWICPRHATIHSYWCYLERSVKNGDKFKWKLRCYKPKYQRFDELKPGNIDWTEEKKSFKRVLEQKEQAVPCSDHGFPPG